MAEEVDGVDIVLGGHDHDYGVEKVRWTLITHSCAVKHFKTEKETNATSI